MWPGKKGPFWVEKDYGGGHALWSHFFKLRHISSFLQAWLNTALLSIVFLFSRASLRMQEICLHTTP